MNLNSSQQGFDNFFIQKQVETMLEINNKKLVSEISALKDSVSKLSQEISDLKKMRVSQPAPEPRHEPRQETLKQEPVNEQRATSSESLRPGYGDYNPEDVSVTKMFYFGNKR